MENNANSNSGRALSVEDSASQTLCSATYADVLKMDKDDNLRGTETEVRESDVNSNNAVITDVENDNSEIRSTNSTHFDSCNEDEASLSRNGGSSSLEGNSLSMVEEITENSHEISEDVIEETVSELVEDQAMNESESASGSIQLNSSISEQHKRKWVSSSSDESDSLDEEDGDDEDSDNLADITDTYPGDCTRWELRIHNPTLPETVTVLNTRYGGKIYLVGTAHFSTESQEDVSKTIRATQPDVVSMELCKSRINILSFDEETILRESRDMNFEKVLEAIRQNGFMQGVLYLLLLNMSAHLTKQLGMAPGGEFRRAFAEAKKVPGCIIHLGDRPIQVTLQRALSTLSLWRKLRVGWYMLTNKDPISKEEVEMCKQKDLLEETLAKMTGEFPELSKVFVEERDIYLTYSLQKVSMPTQAHITPSGCIGPVVVGVVGIGHVPGIVEKWEKISEDDIPPILSIPEPTKSSKVMRKLIRYSIYGLLLYGGYRILPDSISRKPVSFLTEYVSDFINRR